MSQVILTSASSSPWVVPADWNSADNTIELIGGGGGGCNGTSTVGGGGGAYAKKSNIALTPGASIAFQIGAAGTTVVTASGATDGGDTWFDSVSTVLAKGGKAGLVSTGGKGGLATASLGDVTFSGGNSANRGAGGAAGPNGAGNNGSLSTGGSGDAGFGGAAGANGTEWGTAGSGGGGSTGIPGGNYGGGAPGNGGTSPQTAAAGVIVITYTPATGSEAFTESSTLGAAALTAGFDETVFDGDSFSESTALGAATVAARINDGAANSYTYVTSSNWAMRVSGLGVGRQPWHRLRVMVR